MIWNLKYELRRLGHKAIFAVVWALPRGLVYWCGIRLMASATTGKYSGTVVPELTGMEALKRWEHGNV